MKEINENEIREDLITAVEDSIDNLQSQREGGMQIAIEKDETLEKIDKAQELLADVERTLKKKD